MLAYKGLVQSLLVTPSDC